MEHVVLVAEVLGMALIGATIVILWKNIKDFWGQPTSAVFVYYCAAVLLLGLIKIFLHLGESHTLDVGEATTVLGWHLLFYLAMAMFITGTYALIHINAPQSGKPHSFPHTFFWGKAPVIMGLLVVGGSVLADSWITRVFGDSWLDHAGVVHFLAFAISIGVARAMIRLRQDLGPYTRSITGPILWAVLFLGLVHLWELLTESWEVLSIPHETIEVVEVFLTLPALFLVFYAFLRTRRRV